MHIQKLRTQLQLKLLTTLEFMATSSDYNHDFPSSTSSTSPAVDKTASTNPPATPTNPTILKMDLILTDTNSKIADKKSKNKFQWQTN
ncbi:unnamed protein product [Ambrosiozyma monospora]|uniref:Unnamed protein product n=1 Tax=Ambrosiozyma monospora TaxID=43982 RepID=A0A9W6YVA3_AMBMO|nr:unnamed protein product [Ambrosiozyma monospora]